MVKKQNECLNFIKGIACFGIVYMHTSYDCMLSSMIVNLFRFAVPIFFMISGYYSYGTDKAIIEKRTRKKVFRMLKMGVGTLVLYNLWSVVINPMITGRSVNVMQWILSYQSAKNWIDFVLFNQGITGIAWFIFALLYCYIALYLINKFNKYNLAYILAAVLLVAHIVARGLIQYNQLVPEEINIIWFRNSIFTGFPFFMIGNYMHKKEDKIVNRLSNKTLVIGILFGLALSCVERYIVVLEIFWGTVLASLLIFLFALQNPDKKVISVIARIGQRYSMQIYIFQLIVNDIFIYIGNKLQLENQSGQLFAILKPLLIYISIVLVCMAVKEVKNKTKKKYIKF